MKEIDWSNFSSGNKNGGNGAVSFLRFESGKTYRVRPFGNAVQYVKFFIAKGKPSVIVDADDIEEVAKILSGHLGREVSPTFRNAMFVIERSDSGKVKILEGGKTIYDQFASWSTEMNVKPGSGQGGDWKIKVEGEGVGGSNPRTYTTTYLGPVPFSDEEKKIISDLKEQGKLKLSSYLKEVTANKILEVVFGESSSEKEEPVAVTVPTVSTVSNIDIDW